MPTRIEGADRNNLSPLFENCLYDRVLIDSVIEGNFGSVYADSVSEPAAARLDSGAFTMLGGDPTAAGVIELLRMAPIYYVTPQNEGWRRTLQKEFYGGVSVLPFTDFSSVALDPVHLLKWIRAVPPSFELERIDGPLAEQAPFDIGNEYFFENFHSIEDFLKRGIGFCILHKDRIVSAATSMAASKKAIDIEIETTPDFRHKGLGIAVGAKLVLHCLEKKIEPRWLAANVISEKLALKLGYVRGKTYETFALQK